MYMGIHQNNPHPQTFSHFLFEDPILTASYPATQATQLSNVPYPHSPPKLCKSHPSLTNRKIQA